MIWIFFLTTYLGVAVVTFPVASRVIYNREKHKYSNPLSAYRDSLAVGGAIAIFWFVAIPAVLFMSAVMASARIAAPPEVKKMISQHNSLMLEHALGMRQEHETSALPREPDSYEYR